MSDTKIKRTPEEKAARKARKELKRKQQEVDAVEPVVEVAPVKKAKKSKSEKKHENKDESNIYSYKQSSALTNLAEKDIADYLELHNVQIQDELENESSLRPIMNFTQVAFPPSIQKVFVETLKFEKPSPIQYAPSWLISEH
jgi:hypothetical protein